MYIVKMKRNETRKDKINYCAYKLFYEYLN